MGTIFSHTSRHEGFGDMRISANLVIIGTTHQTFFDSLFSAPAVGFSLEKGVPDPQQQTISLPFKMLLWRLPSSQGTHIRYHIYDFGRNIPDIDMLGSILFRANAYLFVNESTADEHTQRVEVVEKIIEKINPDTAVAFWDNASTPEILSIASIANNCFYFYPNRDAKEQVFLLRDFFHKHLINRIEAFSQLLADNFKTMGSYSGPMSLS
jgi:hypothetical protein